MIYLDNCATTKMYEELLEDIKKYSVDMYYNPSALYGRASKIKKDISLEKDKILKIIGGANGKLVFTASGSESDNLAILGSKKFNGGRVLISALEHSAVYNTAMSLESKGYNVEVVPVDRFGKVDIEKFSQMLDKNVMLVSIMHVSNETGSINDIKRLVEIVREKSPRAIFHSDGVQAVGKIKVNVKDLGVDLYSISAHKFHGMKGVGALYVKNGIHLNPIIYGGGQEGGLRSATENVTGIFTMSKALEMTLKNLDISKNMNNLEYLRGELLQINPKFIINTDFSACVGCILSFSIPNTRGEVLVHLLEDNGVIVGTGSACSSNSQTHRVPSALGLDKVYHQGMIRLSFDSSITKCELEKFIKIFNEQYNMLNSIINKR